MASPISSCLGPTFLACPGRATEEVNESASAGNGLPPRDVLKFGKGGRGQRMRGIWIEKFRPFLQRNHCLMMIREPPLWLDPNRTGKDKYMKRTFTPRMLYFQQRSGEAFQGLILSQNLHHFIDPRAGSLSGKGHPNCLGECPQLDSLRGDDLLENLF